MKHRFVKIFGTVSICIAMLATIAIAAHHAPRMTKEALKALLDDPDAKITIIDVRSKTQWEKSKLKVKGAVWGNPADFASWADFTYARDQLLVLYCAWPNEETSARLAQKLIEKGYTKVYALKGGWDGWVHFKYPLEKIVRKSDESTASDKKDVQKQENGSKGSGKKE